MNASDQSKRTRLLRIITRLTERTNTDEIIWERAAPPDSWAVDIGQTRFRVYPEGNERPGYVLDLMGPAGEQITSEDAEVAEALASLYRAADANGKRHTPDPFADIEARLGL
jgi:hypothetical protein